MKKVTLIIQKMVMVTWPFAPIVTFFIYKKTSLGSNFFLREKVVMVTFYDPFVNETYL